MPCLAGLTGVFERIAADAAERAVRARPLLPVEHRRTASRWLLAPEKR
ncbi:hypothetical protein SABIM44S_04680 [Streptomyces abikoensis]